MADTKQVQIHAFQSIPAVRKYRAQARGNAPSPASRRARFRIKSGRSFFLWGYSNLCANFLRTTTLTLSRLGLPRRSPRDYARPPSALPLPMRFCFGGECIEELNGAAGLGRKCKYRKVPRQTNFQKEWRGSKPMCLTRGSRLRDPPPSRSRTNPRHF